MSKLRVANAAPDLTLLDHTGRLIRLGEIWARQPVVLLFLRHLG